MTAPQKASNLAVIFDNVNFNPSDDYRPLLPEGEYQLKLLAHGTELHFGKKPRLVLKFSVVDFGQQQGTVLFRYYNVDKLLSKAGKNGRFKPPRNGDFMMEYFKVVSGCGKPRLDRIPLEPLYKSIIVGRVRTVDRNSQQKALPEQLKYSVVAELLRAGE